MQIRTSYPTPETPSTAKPQNSYFTSTTGDSEAGGSRTIFKKHVEREKGRKVHFLIALAFNSVKRSGGDRTQHRGDT